MEDLHVLPSHRQQGGARALYNSLLKQAKGENVHKIYWRTLPKNTIAKKFYDQIAEKTDWIRYEDNLDS